MQQIAFPEHIQTAWIGFKLSNTLGNLHDMAKLSISFNRISDAI